MAFLDPPDSAQRRKRYWIAAGSVLATTIIMTMFLVESRWGYMKPDPVIYYAQSWKATRTRADAIADAKATKAAREARLAQAQAYVATLSGKARVDAQKQLDAYVEGNGFRHDLPYVAAQPNGDAIVRVPAEPPIE